MDVISLPRSLATGQRLHPVSLSVMLNQTPVHTAEMELYPDESLSPRELVELYTPQGSAGIFRVVAVDRSFGDVTHVTLHHALCTLNDSLLRAIPDEEESETSVRALLAEILAAQTDPLWALGQVDVPDTEVITWKNDDSGLLDALLAVMAEIDGYMLTFDQSRTPWLVNVVALSDDDACECRLNRNMTSLSVSLDTSEMCTRLYLPGIDEPMEADTLPRWGVITRVLEADEELGEELLRQEGQHFLDTHKDPLLTVIIDALDLSRATGEPFDTFRVGRICRVALPGEGTTIRQRVVSVEWSDVYGEPERALVTLSHEAPDAAASIAGLVADTTIVRKRVTKAESDAGKNEEKIDGLSIRLEEANSKLNAADAIFDSIHSRLDDTDSNIERVEKGLKAEHDSNTEQFSAVHNRLDATDSNIEDTDNRVDTLQTSVANKADQFALDATNLKVAAVEATLSGTKLLTKSVALGGLKIIPAYGTITYTTATGGTGSFTAVTSITVTGNAAENITYVGK